MPYIESRPAYLLNYERRFWQGSHDHRGVPEAPGRVVTLIPKPRASCLGRAYLLEPQVVVATFEALDHREKNGYERHNVMLTLDNDESVNGLTYIAQAGNFAYLGDAPLDVIARQIARSSGPSGRNVDYLLELADALRELGAYDRHVFELEERVLALTK